MALNVTGGALEFDAVINNSQFGATIRQMELQLQGLTKAASKETAQMDSLARRAASSIAVFAASFSATSFLTDVVQVRAEFQKLEAVLTNSLGSGSEAQESLQMISDYVARTPFELAEVSNAYVKLVNQGIKPTKEQLTQIGDLAASTGKTFDGLVEAIIDAQTGEFERLKEFGIRASKEGEKVAFTFKGVTQEVQFSNRAIQDYIIGLGNMQGVTGATAAISATLGGQISNLRDAWTRMLNEIGQSNEGIFANAIAGATSLIENYETVIDILKVLVLTYGSYKAAIIAQTAVVNVYDVATKRLSITQTLLATRTAIADRVMALFNRTVSVNPYVAAITGLTALISAMLIFGKAASEVKTKAQLLADAQEKVGNSLAEAESRFRPYLEQLKDVNLSEQQRISIYNEILKKDPEVLKGITAKTLSYQTLKKNVDGYLGALRQQIKLETNKEATIASIKQEQEFERRKANAQKQIDFDRQLIAKQKDIDNQTAREARARIFSNKQVIEEADRLLAQQQNSTRELGQEQSKLDEKAGNGQEARSKRTIAVIDAEIEALKKRQKEESTNHAEKVKFDRDIQKLEAERKRIVGESKSEIKATQVAENKTNQILEQRADLLRTLEDIKKGSVQSGQLKEQTELDKINEKYDDAIVKVSEFNKKVDEFNRKNNANVARIGQTDINALNEARAQEIRNFNLKQDAEKYKANLELQKNTFSQYEEAKKQIGLQKADELYSEQTKGFANYLQFLTAEAAKLSPKIVFGIANIADIEKMKAITKEISAFEKQSAEDQLKTRIANIQRLFQETATVNQRRQSLDAQYERDLASLRKEFKGSELQAQEENLRRRYKSEVDTLQNALIVESSLYQQLNQDILGFSRERIKQEIKLLREQLKSGVFTNADGKQQAISPAMKKQIEDYINSLQDFYGETADVFGMSVSEINQLAGNLGDVSNIFGSMSSAVQDLDGDLGDVLSTLSTMVGVASQAANAIAQFASGNIIGGIGSAIGAIGGLLGLGGKAKAEREAAMKRMQEFQTGVFLGEFAINELYRQRTLEQVRLNKLRLQGIADERKELEKQQQQIAKDAEKVFAELQKQTYKTTGSFSSMFLNNTFLVNKSLAGKTFQEIEELFLKGQLDDKAKELFQTLQKLKAEGADIDRILEENKRKAQEMFTGTTADGLLDSITDGFKNGLRSAQDFAGNFEELMKGAILNSLKYKFLEGPLKQLFEDFAAASESDGQLTQAEITALQQSYNSIINNAAQQFDQLQQIAGLNFSATGGGAGNALVGAIKGMTAEQAELLAGQFGGLRLTAIEQLRIATTSLQHLQQIEINTARTVSRLEDQTTKMENWFTIVGIKIR